TPKSMSVLAGIDRTKPGNPVWFSERPGFFDVVMSVGDRGGPKIKLDLPTDISMDTYGDWLVVKRPTEWSVGGETYPPDTLVGIAFSAFIAGDRNFTVLFRPAERRVLNYFFWLPGRLVLAILDDLNPVFEMLTPSAGTWTRMSLPVGPK